MSVEHPVPREEVHARVKSAIAGCTLGVDEWADILLAEDDWPEDELDNAKAKCAYLIDVVGMMIGATSGLLRSLAEDNAMEVGEVVAEFCARVDLDE